MNIQTKIYNFIQYIYNTILLTYFAYIFCLVWFFTSRSTAMVMFGQSVHLVYYTFFPGQAFSTSCTFSLVTDNRKEENDRRNYF